MTTKEDVRSVGQIRQLIINYFIALARRPGVLCQWSVCPHLLVPTEALDLRPGHMMGGEWVFENFYIDDFSDHGLSELNCYNNLQ